MKQAQLRQSARVWRRESSSWDQAPTRLREGAEVTNLKHGTNILTSGEFEFPPYADLRAEHLKRGMEWMVKSTDMEAQHLRAVSSNRGVCTWEELMHPWEIMADRVERIYHTAKFMSEVVDNSSAVREAFWHIRRLQRKADLRNKDCEHFLRHFKRMLMSGRHSEAQRRVVALQLVSFEEEGVNVQAMGLPREFGTEHINRWRAFRTARAAMFNISLLWEHNVEQDLARRRFLMRDLNDLDGLPLYVFEDAASAAVQAGYPKATALAGPWMITLDDSMLEPILRHAKGRWLREVVYRNRARVAFFGGAGDGDNTQLLERLLELRQTYANMIGHSSWADRAFARKMSTLKQAYGFLARLRRESLPVARRELHQLQEFADEQGTDHDLEHFDLDYWRERLQEERLSLREDYLRPFFQAPVVVAGLLKLLERLFGIRIDAADGEAQVWDEHVRFFRVRDQETGDLISSFFLDLYRRRGSKKPGFWVEPIQDRSDLLGSKRSGPRLAAAHVICDLATPQPGGGPVLMSHQEVAKLFHVMGAALWPLLCVQGESLVGSTKGLELDALNVPAHFLERWAYDKSTLRSISKHVETGDPLPEPAIETIMDSRTFHNGIRMLKRTAFAQIDLDLHAQYDPNGEMTALDVAKLIEAEFSVLPPRVRDHEVCSMPIHGEHAAGIFSDLWSEALAADVFLEFETAGLEDEEAVAMLGRRFRAALLAQGAGRAPALALQDFLGRSPNFAAFLVHAGLDSPVPEEEGLGVQFEDVYEEDDDYVEFVDLSEEYEDEYGEYDDEYDDEYND